jgi:predicted N-acetyltransferase YhbS
VNIPAVLVVRLPTTTRKDPFMTQLAALTEPNRPASPVVRAATTTDHPAIRQVVRAAFGPYAAKMDPQVFRLYLADLLDLNRHAADGQLLVADVDGKVRGFGAFYPESALQRMNWPPGWAGGRGLAVHPATRHQGVARALLAACEERARALGAPVFAFHTLSFMTTAAALYDALGYHRAPTFDVDLNAHYGVHSPFQAQALAYRRELTPVVTPDLSAVPTTNVPRPRNHAPAYYLGRPSAFWVQQLSRRGPTPVPSVQ